MIYDQEKLPELKKALLEAVAAIEIAEVKQDAENEAALQEKMQIVLSLNGTFELENALADERGDSVPAKAA